MTSSSATAQRQPPADYLASSPEYNVPIPERKRPTDWFRTIAFSLFFNITILLAHPAQYFFALLYPFPATRAYYEYTIQYTKLVFGRIIVAITQLFGPTSLVVTCSDQDGQPIDPERLVKRDPSGKIVHIELPKKSIWISNHQVYTDWLYLWCFAYYGHVADSIIIMLQKLYKWLPPIGPAMQFYRFIFLARKWETDKAYLARHLAYLAELASDNDKDGKARGSASKLLLLIFPEGTLVSPLTRPASEKYANKIGIEDCQNLLLPRSTGLLFSLRSLAADIQDLKLVDFTIGYPGVPGPGRAQEFYTLRSTFMQGVAPPRVHLHFTVISVNSSSPNTPPIGKLPAKGSEAASQESTPEEKEIFFQWLLKRWRMKDVQMTKFQKDGDFMGGTYEARRSSNSKAGQSKAERPNDNGVPFIEIPIKLAHPKEFGDCFVWGFPIFACWFLYRLTRLVI